MVKKRFPGEAYTKVFDLISGMDKRPIPPAVLEWEVGRRAVPDQFSALGALNERKSNLYIILRDLIGTRVLEATPGGIDIREPAMPIEEAIGRMSEAGFIANQVNT